MNSFFLAFYQLLEANQAHFTDAELPAVKTVDRFRGQPQNPEQFEFFDVPAIFVGYRIKWNKEGKYYNGDIIFDFHVVQDTPFETSNISVNKEQGLNFELFHTKLRELLDDFETEITTKLQRVDENPLDAGVITYQVISYQCQYQDPVKTGTKYADVQPGGAEIKGIASKKYIDLPQDE